MATGALFVLDAFEARAHNDQELVAILYTGSLGRGAADQYSDLDIELWVTEAAFAGSEDTLRRVMGYLGPVQFLYGRGPGAATGFVGPNWQRADLVLHRTSDLDPLPKYAGARIVKDTAGLLAEMLARVPEEAVRATPEQARAAIEEAIDSQIYAALHNARGAAWSAMGEVSFHAAELYTLLALLRGRRSYGFRYVEQVLSTAERELIARAWPREPERDEVRRAARALWDWTRHVWNEAEAVLGAPLAIELDEAGLLSAVDRLYS